MGEVPSSPGYPINLPSTGIHEISTISHLPWLLSRDSFSPNPALPNGLRAAHIGADKPQHRIQETVLPLDFPEQLQGAKVPCTGLNHGHWQTDHVIFPSYFLLHFLSLFFVPLTFALPISQYPQQVQLTHRCGCWGDRFPSPFDLPAKRETASLFCSPHGD